MQREFTHEASGVGQDAPLGGSGLPQMANVADITSG